MSFQSLDFLAFLALTVAVCLPLGRRHRLAGTVLLGGFCLAFYPAGLGLLLLAVTAFAAWLAARRIGPGGRHRRAIAAVMACWLVGMLLVFKYTGFLTGGAVQVGWVPLGLSFFTFQQLWLLHEAYTGAFLPQTGDPWWLYAFFFPTVTSGPILKPQAFFPQIRGDGFLRPTWQDASAGLYAICWGTVKKVLLADSLGVVVNNGWAHVTELSAPGAWLVMLGYTLQLYFDFSGYCDIATGAARLLGVRLPVNFDSPYRALSVGEFWKRWHITLTSFLRECVYFPLGGSRKGTGRTYLNILIIFLISGWWHGAGWTFLVWGALHAAGQIVERAWGPGRDHLPKWLRWGMTFAFLNVAWVFFRAPTVLDALRLLRAAALGGMAAPQGWLITGLFSSEIQALRDLLPGLASGVQYLLLIGVFAGGLVAALSPGNTIRRMDEFRPRLWSTAALWLLTVWSVLSFSGVTTFIYSNF